MQTFNMHYAKTHLSKLVEAASKGESFIIARAGKPLVKVDAVSSPTDVDASAAAPKPRALHRLGGLAGRFTAPDDIKTPFKDEIEEMFYGKDD